ncbi:tRNA (adenosine(37)-N6)-threonylcarbamoyltransferase complex transferase subunit TsaD [Candidatus Saccharibacteria bacterium]|nr:MAG: tRNA (adenosine(37)-N6)-threonylcarbamoyltransferase complex transferase subunit TsaD [Candidatus Saccharibacteria bacterium]
MKILGIESSCDETAAAVVEAQSVEAGVTLLSNAVASSMDLHVQYGGVVPEIAARSHIEAINGVIQQALDDAGCTWDDIDAIAVTYGAGLGGSLLIGVLAARTLAITKNKPLYAINHVEAHVYANFITKIRPSPALSAYVSRESQPEFPMLALIVSGGHSQLALFRDHFDYTLLGQTADDAIGEAFDKVAKILGLPYPGGPSVGKKAAEGNPHAFTFPKAQMKIPSEALVALREQKTINNKQDELSPKPSALPPTYDYSFSGVKTAVLRTCQELIGEDFSFPSKDIAERLSEAQKADVAASFQRVAVETVVDKTIAAFEEFQPRSVVIAGGVAASPELRRQLSERLPIPIAFPDLKLCTDNGAMIATLACYKAQLSQPQADPYTLDIQPNLSM